MLRASSSGTFDTGLQLPQSAIPLRLPQVSQHRWHRRHIDTLKLTRILRRRRPGRLHPWPANSSMKPMPSNRPAPSPVLRMDLMKRSDRGESPTAGPRRQLAARQGARRPAEGATSKVPRRGLRFRRQKRNIRMLVGPAAAADRDCQPDPAAEVLAMNPDGIFLSNGPGDPEPVIRLRHRRHQGLPGRNTIVRASAWSRQFAGSRLRRQRPSR